MKLFKKCTVLMTMTTKWRKHCNHHGHSRNDRIVSTVISFVLKLYYHNKVVKLFTKRIIHTDDDDDDTVVEELLSLWPLQALQQQPSTVLLPACCPPPPWLASRSLRLMVRPRRSTPMVYPTIQVSVCVHVRVCV